MEGKAAVSWAEPPRGVLTAPPLQDEYFRMKLQWKSVSPGKSGGTHCYTDTAASSVGGGGDGGARPETRLSRGENSLGASRGEWPGWRG